MYIWCAYTGVHVHVWSVVCIHWCTCICVVCGVPTLVYMYLCGLWCAYTGVHVPVWSVVCLHWCACTCVVCGVPTYLGYVHYVCPKGIMHTCWSP